MKGSRPWHPLLLNKWESRHPAEGACYAQFHIEFLEKNITDVLGSIYESDYLEISGTEEEDLLDIPPNKIPGTIAKLSREMKSAAKKLEFEKAAEFRNRIKKLQELELKYAEGVA